MALDQAYENLAMQFLKDLSFISRDNFEKYFDINYLYSQFKINTISVSEFKNKIVPYLVINKWIDINISEVRITYEGIYKVSEIFHIDPSVFGILSKIEINRISPLVINFIKNNSDSEKNNKKEVDIKQIEKHFTALDPAIIRQIIKNLINEDKINIKSNGKIQVIANNK